ncbi:MAG: hypothetical protein IIA60_09040 [Candidatus Marinimicrobia bacterium]|nr:hypothetical protein [Candidatus Neomarinimicrobiota bacterium]
MPTSKVFSHGGKDISDILDDNPNIRQSFPQILGLRDLDKLISESVHSKIVQRSRSAIEEARSLASIFIPTRSYFEALNTLKKHYFVVLDGPPEMGKTAIARILSLVYLLEGFEAIDCRDPDDIFSLFKNNVKQIFIADDAFGRTEYNIASGLAWERDLPKLLNNINENHLLVWTSRKHILQYALAAMDLSGTSRRFPKPSEVLVDASELTIAEKALILYRHGRAVNLEEDERMSVRTLARRISTDKNFTPERIRRLFTDEYNIDWHNLDFDRTHEIIVHSLANPTDHMTKSFNSLSNKYKWLLITILEIEGFFTRASDILERLCQRVGAMTQTTFDRLLNDLDGTFIRVNVAKNESVRTVDWIHPSYRDLLIEVLQNDQELQEEFLKTANVEGITLALSVSGSSYGERLLPFTKTENSFNIIRTRCLEMLRDTPNTRNIKVLFDALQKAVSHEKITDRKRGRIKSIQIEMATLFIEHCQDSTIPLASILESISDIHILYPEEAPRISIIPTLDGIIAGLLEDAINMTEGVFDLTDISFYDLNLIYEIIESYDDHPNKHEFEMKIGTLFDEIDHHLFDSISDVEITGDKQTDEQALSDLENLKYYLTIFSEAIDNQGIENLITKIVREISNLEESIPPDPEDPHEISGGEMGGFSIEGLFSDF